MPVPGPAPAGLAAPGMAVQLRVMAACFPLRRGPDSHRATQATVGIIVAHEQLRVREE